MAVVSLVLTSAGKIYLPLALRHAEVRYGELGVAFALIGWLFAVSFALICTTLLGGVLSREPGPLGRLLARGRSPRLTDPDGAGAE
jgi:membrane protein